MHLIESTPSFYTPSQLDAYFLKIGYPSAHRELAHAGYTEDHEEYQLKRLQLVIRLHLVAFRWSNTIMHYSTERTMDVSPQGVYRVLVEDGTKGSYCFGHNTLLLGMLRAMGYRTYPGSARVLLAVEPNPAPEPFHMLLFVQPFDYSDTRAQETYIADVGYGGSSLCRPILLSDDPKNFVYGTTKSEKHRLVRKSLPESVVPSEKLWEMQLWRSTHPEWIALHSFSEAEVYMGDFAVYSFALCHMADFLRGRVASNVLVTKTYFVDSNPGPEFKTGEVNGEVNGGGGGGDKLEGDLGKVVLFGNELRKSLGEKSEVIRVFGKGPEEERERIKAIKDYFGVVVDEAEVEVIQGRIAGLR